MFQVTTVMVEYIKLAHLTKKHLFLIISIIYHIFYLERKTHMKSEVSVLLKTGL